MEFIKENYKGICLCMILAVPAWILGKYFQIIGSPVLAILFGMILNIFIKRRETYDKGIKFVSKKILQWAVVLLGFGLNLSVVLKTGKESLPIILCTISISLIIAFVLQKLVKIPSNMATLVGVGSSICGGSAIAATAPVIGADDEEIATAISVIFFFNIIAAIIFPILGKIIGFDTSSGEAFGIFAGSAVNDTSSVTAVASTWDSMWNLGTATLDKAVTVKLTRTLAIIPVTLILSIYKSSKSASESSKYNMRSIFPFFIIYFILASLITTVALRVGVESSVFVPIKTLSKFFIVLAMSAIGLNSNIVKLVKNGGKTLFLGLACWFGISITCLFLQSILGMI